MIDLFGTMLAIRVENNHELCLSILPMAQSGFDGLAFTAVLFVHDHFRAGFTRTLGGFVGRTVVDYENVVQLLPGPADNVANMFLLIIGGNDRRDSRHLADNRMKISRVVRAAHERTGSDVFETFFARDLPVN